MKKLIFIITVLWVASSISYAEKLMFSVSGHSLFPADSNFKDVYKNSILYPELRAGVKVFKDIYLWGSYGFFSVEGKTPNFQLEAKSTQNFISFGVGYLLSVTKSISLDAAVGGSFINYKEEAMSLEVTGSKLGLRFDGGLMYSIGKLFFARLSAGYMTASDSVEGVEIKLGGISAGLGIGIKL
ncbi:MAG: hypothetical protein WBB69_13025 [Anaerolineales bacterium]